MKKNKAFLILIISLFLLCSCQKQNTPQVREKTFYTFFDTVISLYSYAGEGEKEFEKTCSEVEKLFDRYNRLFDIYHTYSGLNNLCTVNENAGSSVAVEDELAEFLEYAKSCYYLSNGEVNVMLGPVLNLWKEDVPEKEEAEESYGLCSIDNLEINRNEGTVKLRDARARIDVGALAKGYAVEKVAGYLESKGVTSWIINAGGNVRLIGTKPEVTDWKIAIQSPDGNGYAQVFKLHDISCVTSGSYERYIEKDGKKYHHIIDKDTLMPASYFDSVSVVTRDSAYADCLSTALFCMSYEDGLALAEKLGDFEVMWITTEGEKLYTISMENYISEE